MPHFATMPNITLTIIPLIFILILLQPKLSNEAQVCDSVWTKNRGKLSECQDSYGKAMANIPLFKSVHCFNNGTGLCKGLAGRFELLFNVFEDKVIGAYGGYDKFVDSNGYHQRVPIAYTVDGDVLTSDRVINWANEFTRNNLKSNLLNVAGFNWCDYCETNNWPFRSAIKDINSNNRFHIYFFNKQSCIIDKNADPSKKAPTQYNTRFTHKSTFRVDQDMNPLIFVMEDNKVKDGLKYRMVKNKRQHWTETEYKVIDLPGSSDRHFIEIDDFEKQPQIVTDRRHILSRSAYFATNETVNTCVTDTYARRSGDTTRNSQLVQNYCSLDEVEMADLNVVSKTKGTGAVYEADLHCLPRNPKEAESFFGVNFDNEADWLAFAKDGYAFSAFTTRPSGNPMSVNVIMLFATFGKPESPYDENYPKPQISNYTSTYSPRDNTWTNNRLANSKPRNDMNFVDDIAWLPKCNTILVVYGPLYTEMTEADLLDPKSKTRIGSVYDLNLWEMTNAFFAWENSIYFYHRTNYIVEHKYTCGSNDGQTKLVTATRSGRYMARHGQPMPSIIPPATLRGPGEPTYYSDGFKDYTYFEETFFQKLGFFKGDTNSPEAPDPKSFPYDSAQILPAPPEASNLWLYLIIGLAVLIILTMCIIYLATRRRRRRRQKAEADRLSKMTQRSSGFGGTSGISGAVTNRSGMTEASGASGASSLPQTYRSSNMSRGSNRPEFTKSSKPGSSATGATNRSGLSSSRKNSPSSGASRASSKATGRSGLSKSNSASPNSSRSSRSHSRSRK